MKRLATLVLLLALAPPACGAPPTEFPALLESSPPPSYMVRLFQADKEGNRSAGSGALISDTLILTAAHVVDQGVGSKVEVLFLSNWEVVLGEVVAFEASTSAGPDGQGHDIALVRVESRAETPIPIGAIAAKGDSTVHGFAYGPYREAVGNHYTWDVTSRWGVIRDAQARNGDSGGPITQKGKIVGVLWGASDGYTWFTPIQKIAAIFPQVKTQPLKQLNKVKNANPRIIYSLR